MKKIIFSIFFFLFLLPHQVFAQEGSKLLIPTESISPTPSIGPTIVNYELPYPGILPGSPLYSLKALRDKIIEIFISDPLKKSNFYLLQADKRLASGISLFDLDKGELGETTISKGQNYLEKSIDNVILAKSSQKNISDILAKIRMSSAKQKEQILLLTSSSAGDTKKRLLQDLKRAEELQKRAEAVKP